MGGSRIPGTRECRAGQEGDRTNYRPYMKQKSRFNVAFTEVGNSTIGMRDNIPFLRKYQVIEE